MSRVAGRCCIVTGAAQGIGRAIGEALLDEGAHVCFADINADKVALTGSKRESKMAYRHSGFPGGLTATSYTELLESNPCRAVEKAVKGMLPHNKLGRQQIKKLKVYAGADHPHAAQNPQPFTITQIAQ